MSSKASSAVTAYITGETPPSDMWKSVSSELDLPDGAQESSAPSLERRILVHLADQGPTTRTALRKALDATDTELADAIASLRHDRLIKGGGNQRVALAGH